MTQIKHFRAKVPFKADSYHSEYLMKTGSPHEGVMLGIGLNYIRFAVEGPHLFRFLFQSNFFTGTTLLEMKDQRLIGNNKKSAGLAMISMAVMILLTATKAVPSSKMEQEKGINTVPALSF